MSEADDETIPDSFFDIASGSEASAGEEESNVEEADSSSDDGNASEVEHDMLESIFGDAPATATGAHDDGKDSVVVDASDESEDERKMAATSAATGTKKGKNVVPVHPSNKSTKVSSLAPDVREAGRKARLRLEEEKSKRKEIQRIEDDVEGQDLLMQKVPGVVGTNGDAQKQSKGKNTKGILLTEPARKKRRRPAKAAASVAENATQKKDDKNDTIQIVDLWLPDATSVSMEGRSNLVRVHGLPYGCKPEEIRRFFKGLNTVKIFALASYQHEINGWDCIDVDGVGQAFASNKGRKRRADSNGPVVKRYPSNFRVFVQFESTPGADQALKRSGETIPVSNGMMLGSHIGARESDTSGDESEDNKGNNGKSEKKISAAVFISPVAKIHATVLKKKLLGIDGVKGKALHEVVDDVEDHLPRFVRRTIWALAWMKLRPNQPIVVEPDDDNNEDGDGAVDTQKVADAFAILERRKIISRPNDANSYRLLATAYNSLCDLYASIEDQSAVNMALFRHDPTLMEDSVCRLTDAALDLISTEAERIDLILRWAREALVGST